jgi:hypothetical protein
MYLAATVADHARRTVLGFVAHAAAFRAFKRLSEQWRIAVT